MGLGTSGGHQGHRATSSGIDKITVELGGIKEIEQMFNQLPKRVNKTLIWGRFWKKVTVPLLEAAKREAPLLNPKTNSKSSRIGVSYPPDESLTIARGTLRESIIFYRTRASRRKDVNGGYVGPRVKGKFKKNMGGYFGAWVEYGHRNRDGSMSKPNNWMERAFQAKSQSVLATGLKDAEDIFAKAVSADVRRMKKHGSWGY